MSISKTGGADGYYILGKSTLSASQMTRTSNASTDTTETTIATVTIPGGLCTTNSIIRVWSFWGFTNTGSTGVSKLLNPRIGPVGNLAASSSIGQSTQTTNITSVLTNMIVFDNSISVQNLPNFTAGALGGAASSNAVLTRNAFDFQTPKDLTFNCSWGAQNTTQTQTITLYGFLVELFQ